MKRRWKRRVVLSAESYALSRETGDAVSAAGHRFTPIGCAQL